MIFAMIAFLAVAGGYIATSLLFFKYPHFLHDRKKLKFHCQHISHRGGSAENLENTIAAFQHAKNQGTDMLEIDLQLTKDGEVVVCHDNNLYRTTGVNKNISDLNFEELPPLKPQLPVEFDKGIMCDTAEDRQIPRLREVFERFPTTPINIDIKVDNDLLIKKVSDLAQEFDREEITVWGNFHDKIAKKCYEQNPKIPILFSSNRVLSLIILTYTGLLPFVNIRESCLEIFLPSVYYKNVGSGLKQPKGFKLVIWLLDKLLMRKSIFEHLNKRGIQTYLWVLNEEEEFELAFELGVTGIMTDHPTRLKNFLEKNPKYKIVNQNEKQMATNKYH